jgi:hypothetical protein
MSEDCCVDAHWSNTHSGMTDGLNLYRSCILLVQKTDFCRASAGHASEFVVNGITYRRGEFVGMKRKKGVIGLLIYFCSTTSSSQCKTNCFCNHMYYSALHCIWTPHPWERTERITHHTYCFFTHVNCTCSLARPSLTTKKLHNDRTSRDVQKQRKGSSEHS